MTPPEEKIDWRAEAFLQDDPDRAVLAALVTPPKQADTLARTLGLRNYGAFHFVDTIVTRTSAADLLAWQARDDVLLIEPITDDMGRRVTDLLTELYRVVLYHHLGSFHPAVLNLSIGVPREWLNQGLTADRVVHRALQTVSTDVGIPVVMSAGNDGPAPGLINPWALAPGVFIVGATDEDGTRLWERSSRFASCGAAGRRFFVAHGENTVGALASDDTKTPEQLAAEQIVDLAAIVGADNVARYSVRSGTSFAAAKLSRAICLVHQAVKLLQARASTNTGIGQATLEPFVRAYIDSGFDRGHPVFANRLADERRHFGPPTYPLTVERKQQYWALLVSNAIDLPIRYTPLVVERLLRKAARPVPGCDADTAGAGFVSWEAVAETLRALRMSDLIALFGDPDDTRNDAWRQTLAEAGDPLLFDPEDIGNVNEYCQNCDLVLGLPLSGPKPR